MYEKRIIPIELYIRKFWNTFLPRFLFRLSPSKNWSRLHWSEQREGDTHGYSHYCTERPTDIILSEIQLLVPKEATVLDLGCNCGYYLSQLKSKGFYHLTGVDICGYAIEYGKEHLNLNGVELITGGFEDILPELHANGRRFRLIYTVGATVELVHPSFDIIRYLCSISDKYIVLIISFHGHDYTRFWEYEFNRHGFFIVKCITPYDGGSVVAPLTNINSLIILQKVE